MPAQKQPWHQTKVAQVVTNNLSTWGVKIGYKPFWFPFGEGGGGGEESVRPSLQDLNNGLPIITLAPS
jgi:hypothetical protein